MLGEAEEEYVDETRYEEDTGYQPESDEEAEYQRATALVAERYDADNEPGEYTDEEIDENGVSSHLQYEGYTLTALNTSHGCRMGCPAKHMLVSCPVWQALSAEDKKIRVFSLKLCTNCFSSAHQFWRDCPKPNACDTCDQPHHRSLHKAFAGSKPVTRERRNPNQGQPRGRGQAPSSRRPFGSRLQGRGGQQRPPPPPTNRRRD